MTPCELDAAGFEAIVARAHQAIDDDDVIAHGTAYRELQGRVACLTVPVPAAAWAEFLVSEAVVEFALGQRWQQPLATALAIDPNVARYGPDDIVKFVAPIQPTGPALPTDAYFMVDGMPPTGATVGGIHIVQRQPKAGGPWDSRLIRDDPFPAEWMTVAPVAPPTVIPPPPAETEGPTPVLARIGVLGAYGGWSQRVDAPGDWLADDDDAGPRIGLVSDGHIGTGRIGGAWALQTQVLGGVQADGSLGLAIGAGHAVYAVVAAAIDTVTVVEGGESRVVVVPQPELGARFATGGDGVRFRGGAAGGFSGPGVHARGDLGLAGIGGSPLIVGVDGGWVAAAFRETDGTRTANADRYNVGLSVGIELGRP
jgi:hypothetical protein